MRIFIVKGVLKFGERTYGEKIKMGIKRTELMPFIKFAQSYLRLTVHDKKRRIKGTFRDVGTDKIIKGDNFEAVVVGNSTAEETYKTYLRWNNHIKEEFEQDREYVHAEWDKDLEEKD